MSSLSSDYPVIWFQLASISGLIFSSRTKDQPIFVLPGVGLANGPYQKILKKHTHTKNWPTYNPKVVIAISNLSLSPLPPTSSYLRGLKKHHSAFMKPRATLLLKHTSPSLQASKDERDLEIQSELLRLLGKG